jgi:hypothetical protein
MKAYMAQPSLAAGITKAHILKNKPWVIGCGIFGEQVERVSGFISKIEQILKLKLFIDTAGTQQQA